MKQHKYRVRFTGVSILEISPHKLEGLSYAGEGSYPGMVRFPEIKIKFDETETIANFLERNATFTVEILNEADNKAVYWKGVYDGTDAWVMSYVTKEITLIAAAEVVRNTVDILDPVTGEPYLYLPVHTAIIKVLEALNISDYEINPATLDLDSPVPVAITRLSPDLADSDLTRDYTNPPVAPVTTGGIVYAATGAYIIGYNPVTTEVTPCAYLPGHTILRMGIKNDGGDDYIIMDARRGGDTSIVKYTVTPSTSLEWLTPIPTGNSYELYGPNEPTPIYTKTTRWLGKGQESGSASITAGVGIGYPRFKSTKEIGVLYVDPRVDAVFAFAASAGDHVLKIAITPGTITHFIGKFVEIVGIRGEALGEIKDVVNLGDFGGLIQVAITVTKPCSLNHEIDDDIVIIQPERYPSPNPLLGRPEYINLVWADADIKGGRFLKESVKAVFRRDVYGTINPYYLPLQIDGLPAEIPVGHFTFFSETEPIKLGDRFHADAARSFYILLPARANILPNPAGDYELYQNQRESTLHAPGAVKVKYDGDIMYDGPPPNVLLYKAYGNMVFADPWIVTETLVFNEIEIYSRVIFSKRTGTDNVPILHASTRDEYHGDEMYLRGEPYVINGILTGCMIHRVNDWVPINNKVILALKPADGTEITVPGIAPQKSMAMVLLNGDCVSEIDGADRLAFSDNTTEITRPGIYVPSEYSSGYRFIYPPAADIEGSDISFTASGSSIDSTYTVFNTSNIEAGTKITISGTENNNGLRTVVTVTANRIVVSETIVDEAAGPLVVISIPSNTCKCLTETHAGLTTALAIFNVPYDTNPEIRDEFCGRYLWGRQGVLNRPLLYSLDTDTSELTYDYLLHSTNEPAGLSEYQAFIIADKPGVELSEGEDWILGTIYEIPDADIDTSTVRVFRGNTELNVILPDSDTIPEPDLLTAYVRKIAGTYNVYVKGIGSVYASYNYYPDVELTGIAGEYAVDSEGYVYAIADFIVIGKLPAGIVPGYAEVGDDIYVVTTEGHLCVISPAPPAVAEGFGGTDINAVSALGNLARQSNTRLIYKKGRYLFNETSATTAIVNNPYFTERLKKLNKPTIQAIEISHKGGRVAYGDLKAAGNAVKGLDCKYLNNDWIAEAVAEYIYDRAANRRAYKAEGLNQYPDKLEDTEITIGDTTYEIIRIMFDGVDVDLDLKDIPVSTAVI